MINAPTNDLPLRIAIDAQRSTKNGSGGVEAVLIGLVSALGKLQNGNEEYTLIVSHEDPDWLRPFLGPNQHLVFGPETNNGRPFTSLPTWIRPMAKRVHGWVFDFVNPPANNDPVPLSDGFYENLGCELIHFPSQKFVLCALPSIYTPHDLQHLHFPQFFKPSSIKWREQMYSAGCHFAQVVITGSQWIKDDIIKNYHTNTDKIQVIPWAPPIQVIAAPSLVLIEKVKNKYHLPKQFAFYPAMTWEHKNHIRLLDSLASLRDKQGIIINLVCTGNFEHKFWPKINERIIFLGLNDQVNFLGTIPFEDLRAIYQLCQFLVVPTLFEAASGPIFEAWQEGVPVTCSTVTSLPEQVKDAALLFDPFSVEEIANALKRMATDENLRGDLIKKGSKRLMDFSWERTAKAYRAVYRRVANRQLTDEDRRLLSWDWMRNSEPENMEIM